ncbi:MAG: TolC family protein, partial [Lewinella sp.]
MRLLYLYLTLLAPACIFAQNDTEWTLEESVTYARENGLQVRRLDNSTELARLDLQQSKNNRLPNVNGGTSVNLLLGRSIDPTTNTFEAQNIFSQGYQLQGAVTIYDGGFIRNSIRRSEIDLEAAQTDAAVAANDIGLLVANSYLTILLSQEQLVNARVQLELVDEQLANTDAQI